MTLYEHKGSARKATLTTDITSGDLLIPGDDLAGWPVGADGLFWGVLDRDTVDEEKILLSARSGNTLQVFSDVSGNGRGKDDTTAKSHKAGATLEHVWTATEASDASIHQNTGDGAHGYPPISTLVTLTGAQDVHEKHMIDMTATDPAMAGGEHTAATLLTSSKAAVLGAQAEAEFRVRNVYIGSGVPSDSLGSDGDLYISKD